MPETSTLFCGDASGTTYGLNINDGTVTIYDYAGGFVSRVTIGSPLVTGNWYFIAMRVNALVGTLSLGTEDTAPIHNSGAITAQGAVFQSICIGAEPNMPNFSVSGDICLARLWNGVLSDAEILAEKESPTVVKTSDLTASWELETVATVLDDTSGNNNDLTAPATGAWAEVAGPSF